MSDDHYRVRPYQGTTHLWSTAECADGRAYDAYPSLPTGRQR